MKFNYVRDQWDRCSAGAAFLLGLVALLLGWIGVSGTPHVADQMAYIVSGGIFGIFLLGTAAVLWLSADLRDEWRELHGIRELLKASISLETDTLPTPAKPRTKASGAATGTRTSAQNRPHSVAK